MPPVPTVSSHCCHLLLSHTVWSFLSGTFKFTISTEHVLCVQAVINTILPSLEGLLKKYLPSPPPPPRSPAEAELAVQRLFHITHLARVSTVSRGRMNGVCFFLSPYRMMTNSGYSPAVVLESSSVERREGEAGVESVGAHLQRFQ